MATPDHTAHQTVPRDIVVSNPTLEYGHIEAWSNIIASYQQKHPEHRVLIWYEGEQVYNMVSLFKKSDQLDPNAFQMSVSAPDSDWKDVPKLYRLLVEGAGPNYRQFLHKEIYQVLKLF